MNNISVVMAVHNGEAFLQVQVESVLRELRPGDEFIVINDASVDSSLALLGRIESPLLKIHTNPLNTGVMASFEKGLRLTTKEFIFLADQDDIWLSGKRSAFVEAFENDPAVCVVISDAEMIDANGEVFAPSMMATRQGFNGSVFGTLWRNRYLGCAMALRRPVLKAVLPIPSKVPMHDMWFGAIASTMGKVAYLPTPYLQYRRHGRNVTPSRRQSLGRMLMWRINLLTAIAARMLSRSLGMHHPFVNERGSG